MHVKLFGFKNINVIPNIRFIPIREADAIYNLMSLEFFLIMEYKKFNLQ